MISRIALISTLAVAGSAFGQDVPDRNPEQNADGTKTYWTGNNMQWDTQEAIDDCNPGDIIVIRGGDYVNSLSVDKPNITIRPLACTATILHDLMGEDADRAPEASLLNRAICAFASVSCF